MASSDFIKQGVPVQVDNSFLQGPEAKLEKCALSGDTISLFNSQRAIFKFGELFHILENCHQAK